jgi:hypothetical protein
MTQPATPLLSEPGQTRALKIICILVCMLSVSCVHGGDSSSSVSLPTNTSSQTTSPTITQSKSEEAERMAALREALQSSAKEAEDRARGIPLRPSQFPFPNYDTGPKRPYPVHVNLYSINDHYPDYLECQFDVDEKNYNQSDEPKWFKESLKQIRKSGHQEFPQLKWIAVIIKNRVEHKDESTFEQAHKVGAIFKASDVFDSSKDLSQMIAAATMDRHPFFLDPQRSKHIPMEQQRWMIVERHAATNHSTTGSN